MTKDDDENFFIYFAYGSNLLDSRIKINSPDTRFLGIGFLKNYALNFAGHSMNWNGGTASIYSKNEYQNANVGKKDSNSFVVYKDEVNQIEGIFGVVWKIHKKHLTMLDAQEGVHLNEYQTIQVELNFVLVESEPLPEAALDKENFEDDAAHLNQLQKLFQSHLYKNGCKFQILEETIIARTYTKIPPENYQYSLPSGTYKLVILKGAIKLNLPHNYINLLCAISVNTKPCSFTAWKNEPPTLIPPVQQSIDS